MTDYEGGFGQKYLAKSISHTCDIYMYLHAQNYTCKAYKIRVCGLWSTFP